MTTMEKLRELRDAYFGETPQLRRRSYGMIPFIFVFAIADAIAEGLLCLSPDERLEQHLAETSIWRYLKEESRR